MTTTTTAQFAGFSYGTCARCPAAATYFAPLEDGTEVALCKCCADEDYPGEVPTL